MLNVQHHLTNMLKQLGVAALYASLLYVGDLYFESETIVGYFEPASGLALAALLIGGKRYVWGVLLGAILINALFTNSFRAAVILTSCDVLQAFCGAWLLTREGCRFDLHLRSLRAYLRLILLGGCASVAIGALAVNSVLLFSRLLTPENYFHSLIQWWMSDTLGVILITPLMLVWWRTKNDWREARQIIEAIFLLGLTVLVGQIVFLGWLHDSVGQIAKGYWLFLLATWVAVRLGTRGTVIILIVVAIQALLGAIWGTGFFADDIANTYLLNYWFYMVSLSVVSMALATYFAERKQMEQSLRSSEMRFRSIIEASPVPFALNDEQQNITYLNSSFIRTFGYTRKDIPTLADWWPKAYPDLTYRQWVAAIWQTHLEKSKRENEPFEPLELDIRCKDGGIKTALTGASPVGASFEGVHLVSLYDITERKRMDAELRESEELLRAITDNTSAVIFLKDLSGRYLHVNRQYEKLFHVTNAEIQGKTDHDIFPPDMASAFIKNDQMVAQSRKSLEIEEQVPHDDGIHTYISVKFPLRHISGEIYAVCGIATDITERKRAEEQIYNLAFYDSLTQLPNRRLLNDRLGQTMATSKRSGHYGALMFLDLDNFKPLNDTYGHGVGDLLLVEVAHRLAGCVREVDTVARFGGDEFVVMLSELDTDKAESTAQAGIVAEKIRAALFEPYLLALRHEGGAETTVDHHCAASIGVVLFISHEAGAEDIIKWADMAMYQAKEGGRNKVCFYE